MINKIFKRIHNKYSTLFKFLFFLRHLFGIFFISLLIYFLTPHFFDLNKKNRRFYDYLSGSYGLTLNSFENIKYNSLPIPSYEIQNADIGLGENLIQMNVESIIVYPKLLNIYNYENSKKNILVLSKGKILLPESDLKFAIEHIKNLKNKLNFKNLNLKIIRNNLTLINLNKIYFSNYGYNKNLVKGELFDKKFKLSINDNYDNINFRLLKTGISADIDFKKKIEDSKISGFFKFKILKSNFKFNFDFDEKQLNIYNSYFRSKNLSFNNESTITYLPFFYSSSIVNLEDINIEIFKNINLSKILTFKNLIKKINIKNEIYFNSKKFKKNLINNLNLNINLAYGKLIYSKKISIFETFSSCDGDINLLEEYPILHFDCLITAKDKMKLLRIFSIKYNIKDEMLKLNIKGKINILNNKIIFENITMNQNYQASKEDLNYFKQSFENILLDKGFLNIFSLKKIKEFILEIT